MRPLHRAREGRGLVASCDCGAEPHKVYCAVRDEARRRRLAEAAQPSARVTAERQRELNRELHVKVWRATIADNKRLGRRGAL